MASPARATASALFAAAAIAAVSSAALASKQDATAPRLIRTASRIEVDAQGRVTSVTTTPQLPADIAAVVEGNVRKLRFAPPMKDGRAVGGVTFVWQEACALPVDGQYRFAVKYEGNGPGTDVGTAPVYPHDAEHRGVMSNWQVQFIVDDQGHASVVDMKRTGGDGMLERSFRAELSHWITSQRFQPELLDGKPVATRMKTEVNFVLGRRAERSSALASDACQVALDEHANEQRTVALDSPFALVATQD